MAVAFDAVGPSSAGTGSQNAATITPWTHTSVGTTGLAGVVVVALGAANTTTNAYTISVTWGGVAMTSLGKVFTNNSTAGYVQMFGIIAPPTGAQSIAVTASGAPTSLNAGSVSFTGAGSFGTATTAFGNTTTATAAIPGTSTANMITAGVAAGSTLAASTGVTSRWLNNLVGSTGAGEAAQGTAAGIASGSASMTWTVSPADFWGIVGVEVKASAAAATHPGAFFPFL